MRKENCFLENVNKKEDYINLLKIMSTSDEKTDLDALGFFEEEIFEESLKKLEMMTSQQEKRFISLIHHVDNYLNNSKNKTNEVQKITTITAAIIYLVDDNYLEYTNDEITLLANFSYYKLRDFYEQAYIFYPKELLQIIISKNKNYMIQETYMLLTEKLYDSNKTLLEIENYLSCNDNNMLLQEAYSYENKIVGEFDETRRI